MCGVSNTFRICEQSWLSGNEGKNCIETDIDGRHILRHINVSTSKRLMSTIDFCHGNRSCLDLYFFSSFSHNFFVSTPKWREHQRRRSYWRGRSRTFLSWAVCLLSTRSEGTKQATVSTSYGGCTNGSCTVKSGKIYVSQPVNCDKLCVSHIIPSSTVIGTRMDKTSP